MKQGWEIKNIGSIADITDYVANGSFATLRENVSYLNEEGYAILVRLADYTNGFDSSKFVYIDEHAYNFLAKSKLYGGEIIMSNVGSIGKCFKCPDLNKPMSLAPNSIVIRTPNNDFYHYVFQSFYFQSEVKRISSQTALPKFNKTSFKNINVPIPPREEQERIVAELDCLSSVIEKKREQLRELDALAQSIFYQMFGDPITNEKGWNVKKLGEIATSQIGITYKPENVSDNDEGTIVLRSSNIQNSTLCFEDIVRVKCEIKENKYVKDGDILMCSRNGSFRLVGKVAMIANLPEPMTYGAFMTIIRSPYQAYLFAFFKSPAFRAQLTTSKTATINQITVKMLDEIKVALPPLTLQQQFAEKIEAIEKQKELIKQSITQTEELFNSRMDYYFN